MISLLSSSFQFVFAKLLFDAQPNFTPEMGLTIRSTFSLIILLVLINVNLKAIMYDSVNKKDYPFIAFRTAASTMTQTINSYANKYIPLTIIGVVNNLSPAFTVLLAYIFLGERLKVIELVFFALLTAGVFLIVIGAKKSSNSGEKTIR